MGHKAKVEFVLDCAEPRRLATFWREALGYRDFYTDEDLAVLDVVEAHHERDDGGFAGAGVAYDGGGFAGGDGEGDAAEDPLDVLEDGIL